MILKGWGKLKQRRVRLDVPFDVLGEPICISVPVHGFLKQNPQSGLASRAGAGEQPSHHGDGRNRACVSSSQQLAQEKPWLGSIWEKESLYVVSTPVKLNKAQFYSKLTSRPSIK